MSFGVKMLNRSQMTIRMIIRQQNDQLSQLRLQFTSNKMVTIIEVRLKTIANAFTRATSKAIRFQQKNNVFISKLSCNFVNTKQIYWAEEFNFRSLSSEFDFQIFDKHIFGFNQSELDGVYSGKISINENNNEINCQVVNINGTIVGYLSLTAKPLNPQSIDLCSKRLKIFSIVAHVPKASECNVFLRIAIGKKCVQTVICKTLKGEMVFVEPYELDCELGINQAKVSVCVEDSRDYQHCVAFGKLVLIGARPAKKVLLYDVNSDLQGEAYIDCFLTNEATEVSVQSATESKRLSYLDDTYLLNERTRPRKRKIHNKTALNNSLNKIQE